MDDVFLADLLNDKDEEISKLKRSLEKLNEDLVKAGELGNGLLQRNSSLEEMIDKMQSDHATAVEEYEQEKYTLENKLELMTKMQAQVESNLQEEAHRWKVKFSQTEQQLNKKHGDELSAIKMQLGDANVQLQQEKLTTSQLKETIELKTAQISKCQEELKRKQTSLNDTLNAEVGEISHENCELKLQLQEMEVVQHELTQTIHQLKSTVETMKNNEENLREAKESVEKEVSSYYNSLEGCREECRELQAELDSIKLQPNDPNAKGNSLFAEVEDKRIQAEKSLVSMKSRYKCMQEQNEQLKHYTLRLKMQISALLETRSRTMDQRHVRSLEESLSLARSDNNKLVQKLEALQNKLKKLSHDHNLQDNLSAENDSGVLEFFKNELKEKNSEVKRLNEELRLSELYLMAETKKVSALERDLYDQGRQLDAALSAKFKLLIDIDRLKIKCGEDVQVRSYKHKWKSEKLTEASQDSAVLRQHRSDCEDFKPTEEIPKSADKQEVSPNEDRSSILASETEEMNSLSNNEQPLEQKRTVKSRNCGTLLTVSSQSEPEKNNNGANSRIVTSASDCKQQ